MERIKTDQLVLVTGGINYGPKNPTAVEWSDKASAWLTEHWDKPLRKRIGENGAWAAMYFPYLIGEKAAFYSGMILHPVKGTTP